MTFDELQRIADENPYIAKVKQSRDLVSVWVGLGGSVCRWFWSDADFGRLNHGSLHKELFGHISKNHPKRKFFSMGFAPNTSQSPNEGSRETPACRQEIEQ